MDNSRNKNHGYKDFMRENKDLENDRNTILHLEAVDSAHLPR